AGDDLPIKGGLRHGPVGLFGEKARYRPRCTGRRVRDRDHLARATVDVSVLNCDKTWVAVSTDLDGFGDCHRGRRSPLLNRDRAAAGWKDATQHLCAARQHERIRWGGLS